MLLKFLSSTSGSRNFWFLSNFLNSSSNSTEIADFSSDDELSKKNQLLSSVSRLLHACSKASAFDRRVRK